MSWRALKRRCEEGTSTYVHPAWLPQDQRRRHRNESILDTLGSLGYNLDRPATSFR